jgi:hypothetical protein
MRKISFEEAKAKYPYRYTLEHVPDWAKTPMDNGKYYAPHYRTCREWYEKTRFPGEEGGPPARSPCCMSEMQSWPLGMALDAPLGLAQACMM